MVSDLSIYDTILDDLQAVCASIISMESFPSLAALEDSFARVKGCFHSDYDRVRDCLPVLCDDDLTAFGVRAEAIFTRWESEEGGGPVLPAFLAVVADHWGLDRICPLMKAAMMAAVLAEIPNNLPYHGNAHYRKVLFHTVRLIATHNQRNIDENLLLERNERIILMIAACLHDLGHEGGDNARDGVYTPGYIEQKSVDYARPYLEAVGLDATLCRAVETMVFCTDVAPFAGDNSPYGRLKKIYDYYFNGRGARDDIEMMMMGKLRPFEDNARLVFMALLLSEADFGAWAGMSYEWAIRETEKLMEERMVQEVPAPKSVLAYLVEWRESGVYTPAAQELYGATIVQIIEEAAQEIRARSA